jgi:hypothetical protein
LPPAALRGGCVIQQTPAVLWARLSPHPPPPAVLCPLPPLWGTGKTKNNKPRTHLLFAYINRSRVGAPQPARLAVPTSFTLRPGLGQVSAYSQKQTRFFRAGRNRFAFAGTNRSTKALLCYLIYDGGDSMQSTVSRDAPDFFQIDHVPVRSSGGNITRRVPDSWRPPTAPSPIKGHLVRQPRAKCVAGGEYYTAPKSKYAFSEFGQHTHLGQRLQSLQSNANRAYQESAQQSCTLHNLRCSQPVGGDPNVKYPHAMAKMKASRRRAAEAQNGIWHNMNDSANKHKSLSHQRLPARHRDTVRGNQYAVQGAVNVFRHSYRPRRKDHIAWGCEPRQSGHQRDTLGTNSLYTDTAVARPITPYTDRPFTPCY